MEHVVERGQVHGTTVHEVGRSSKTSGTIQSFPGNGRHMGSGLDPVMQEMVTTASSLHSFLVLPWYSRVSPDNHFSYQVCKKMIHYHCYSL